jgi:hypothetical protein
MHVLVGSNFLASAHKPLAASCASSIVSGFSTLFLIYNCHVIEIILGQIQMFSGFGFHFFSGVKIDWQLLNLKTIFIGYFMCHTANLGSSRRCPLLLMVVTKRYLGVALVR